MAASRSEEEHRGVRCADSGHFFNPVHLATENKNTRVQAMFSEKRGHGFDNEFAISARDAEGHIGKCHRREKNNGQGMLTILLLELLYLDT